MNQATLAWACRMTKENQGAIASENPRFDLVEFEQWIKDHDGLGYFLRDEGSQFDCRYFSELVFYEMYRFESGDEDSMFRRVVKVDSRE